MTGVAAMSLIKLSAWFKCSSPEALDRSGNSAFTDSKLRVFSLSLLK
ncbi:hypothetical protein A2U01_0111949, partial [Trifolium medium]|nr:hypothetical protein [Trifolium medium]